MGRRPAAIASLAEEVRPTVLARDQHLEVLEPLASVLPGGLRRGSTVAVTGTGATSLALAVAAGSSVGGSWIAAVGVPSLGLVAASELGLALDRFAMVAAPDPSSWATVVAALVDAFEVLLLRATHRVGAADARRLTARARERGAVLVQVGGSAWPEPAETRLEVVDTSWEGLGDGHGRLTARRMTVAVSGRREAARSRQVELWLPASGGGVDVVSDEPRAALHRVS